MGDDYMWVWADRSSRVAVLRVRGELDTVTAAKFAKDATRELGRISGPVTVDLSFLDFLDCAGARVLSSVLHAIPPWQLVDVCGVQPAVARLLRLVGVDLSVFPAAHVRPVGGVARPDRGG